MISFSATRGLPQPSPKAGRDADTTLTTPPDLNPPWDAEHKRSLDVEGIDASDGPLDPDERYGRPKSRGLDLRLVPVAPPGSPRTETQAWLYDRGLLEEPEPDDPGHDTRCPQDERVEPQRSAVPDADNRVRDSPRLVEKAGEDAVGREPHAETAEGQHPNGDPREHVKAAPRERDRLEASEKDVRDFPAQVRQLALDPSIPANLDQEPAIVHGKLALLMGDRLDDPEAATALHKELIRTYLEEEGNKVLLLRTLEAPGGAERVPPWVHELRDELVEEIGKEAALDLLRDNVTEAWQEFALGALEAALSVPTGPVAALFLVRQLLKERDVG